MSLLDQLSSQTGDHTQRSNDMVAAQCLSSPELLSGIAAGLSSKDSRLAGDCAEVFTKVAESNPELVAPFAEPLAQLLTHKTTRVRWEAAHALSFTAALIPKTITPRLPQLKNIITRDQSVIVRDYAVDILGNYAAASRETAQKALPLLKECLAYWEGKHAQHALNGLQKVAEILPEMKSELKEVAQSFLTHPKSVVRQAAQKLLKVTE
jgi:HEAT repeat protein